VRIVNAEFKSLALFPLGMTLFPDGIIALNIFEPRYLSMIKSHHQRGEPFGVITLIKGLEIVLPEQEISLAGVGTLAKIIEFEELQPALFRIKCVGWSRFKIQHQLSQKSGVHYASVTLMEPDPVESIPLNLQDVATTLGKFIAQNQQQGVKLKDFPFTQPFRLDECGWVANRWAEILTLEREEKVELLSIPDPVQRLSRIREILF
jgi:Lon protease-like protein